MASRIPQSAPDLRRFSCHEVSHHSKRRSLTPAMDNLTHVPNTSSATIVRRSSKQRPLEDPAFFQKKNTEPKKTRRSYSMHSWDLIRSSPFQKRFSSYPIEDSFIQQNGTIFNPSEGKGFYQMLRNFLLTSQGVINQGDSFRSHKVRLSTENLQLHQIFINTDIVCPLSARKNNISDTSYKITISGSLDVGKSLLARQFTTSECIYTYNSLKDDGDDISVNVVLKQDESKMVFSERNLEDDKCPELLCTMRSADAHVIVYSIADYSSFQYATRFLKRLSARVIKPTILVGNKTDLVRLRTVTTSEGCSLARQHGCKFIETSACLNYHVDDLLVGVLTQIRLNNCGGKQYQEKPTSISLKMEWKAAYSRRKETFSRAFLKSCLNSHEGVKIYT